MCKCFRQTGIYKYFMRGFFMRVYYFNVVAFITKINDDDGDNVGSLNLCHWLLKSSWVDKAMLGR